VSTLDVAADALVRHGNGRYSDALICNAIGNYVGRMGAIPDNVWGNFPWVPAWRQQWHDAIADRVKEAGYAYERLDDVGQTLIQVAADYSHSDVRVAANFAVIDTSPVMAYVSALEHPQSATAHPGGKLTLDGGFPGGNVVVRAPDNTPEGHALNQATQDGILNATEMWPAGTDLSQTPSGKLRTEMMTEGRRKLWEFLNDWSGQLVQAEKIVSMWGVSPQRSCMDTIDEAKDAWPGSIANHANLLKAGSNAYRDLKENMAAQVKDLQQYWTSPGASGAYCIYADSLGGYYETIAGNLQWLGEEGEKAAHTIDSLQLAYANLGYEHMGIISEQLKAYFDAANSLSHSVDKPLEALSGALSALADSLFASWDAARKAAQSDLSISQTVIDDAPHFNDVNHDVAQPPQSPSTSWRTSAWKP
jgi:uncharacterized protein YukE